MSDYLAVGEPEHEELRATVRDYAEAQVGPRVAEMEASGAVEKVLAVEIARKGWIGATIPREFGGMGAGHLAKTIIIEELSRVSGAVGAITQASQLGTAKILHWGTPAQKRRWLPPIATGDCLPTIAVTESESGSHVLGTRTTAHREGDDYVLNGCKLFVGNSHIGHLHGVVARTGPGVRGLTAFLVEADRPGLRLAPREPTLGLHGFSFGEIILDSVRVPDENRLGAEGDGRAVADWSSTLYGRPNLTAVALGIHRAILETTVALCRERTRYGEPLHELPTVKDKLGRLRSRLMTARVTAYDAAHRLDLGQSCDAELMNAKLVGVELLLDSARAAMEIYGAAGLLTTNPLERYLRDAHHLYAPAGTGDVQALRLAQMTLGTRRSSYSQNLTTRHIEQLGRGK